MLCDVQKSSSRRTHVPTRIPLSTAYTLPPLNFKASRLLKWRQVTHPSAHSWERRSGAWAQMCVVGARPLYCLLGACPPRGTRGAPGAPGRPCSPPASFFQKRKPRQERGEGAGERLAQPDQARLRQEPNSWPSLCCFGRKLPREQTQHL